MNITPERLEALVPGAQVVRVPDAWFERLDPKHSVYPQFYRLLESSGCTSEGLHNRTWVGSYLGQRLLKAERKYLQRKGLKGEKLEAQLWWNDAGAGPRDGEFAGHCVTGETACVFPEDWWGNPEVQRVLDRLFQTAQEKKRRLDQKKRSKMEGHSFYIWLQGAQEQDNPIGDLARDAASDRAFPRQVSTFQGLVQHITGNSPNQWLEGLGGAIADAWLEYTRKYPERMTVEAWCDACWAQIGLDSDALDYGVLTTNLEVLHYACVNPDEDESPLLSLRQLQTEGWKLLREFAGEPLDATGRCRIAACEKRLRCWGFRLHGPEKEQVYFIQTGISGPIKIGYTTQPVSQRIASLQTSCAEPLRLLAVLQGGRQIEADLHLRFAEYRLQGEWFEPHLDLIAFLAPIRTNPSF